MNEELLKFLRLQLGLAADTPEATVLTKLQEMLPVLSKAKTDLGTANSELTALKAKYPEGTAILSAEDTANLQEHTRLKAEAEIRLTALRNETIKLYHLSVGGADKADAGVIKLISNASEEATTALYKQYDTLIESTHKLTCQGCGSTNISRASAKGAKLGIVGQEKNDDEPVEVKDNQEVSEFFSKPKSNTGILYPTKK